MEFGPDRAVAWSRPVPPGKSSPILVDGRLILTGIDGEMLVTLAFDAGTGELLWRRDIERARRDEIFRGNDSATPTPATDGENVYVFFTELGLVSFDMQGNERWRHPFGPFENFYGIGTAPVVAGDLVLVVADQAEGAFLLALDADTGKVRWRASRPGRTEIYTTPILHPLPSGPAG